MCCTGGLAIEPSTSRAEFEGTAVNVADTIGEDFSVACSVQIMLSDVDNKLQDAAAEATTPYNPDLGEIGSPQAESQPDDDGRLSTIPEDSEEERAIWLLLDEIFPERPNDDHLLEVCRAIHLDDSSTGIGSQHDSGYTYLSHRVPLAQEPLYIPCYISPKYDTLDHPIQEYARFLMAGLDIADYGIAHATDEQGNAMWNWLILGIMPSVAVTMQACSKMT